MSTNPIIDSSQPSMDASQPSMDASQPSMDASYPSICIPRTFSSIRWQHVKTVFEHLFGNGAIERVDVASKTTKDGTKFNCMFVHFNVWPDNEYCQEVRRSILAGKTIKIVYDEPWYWKCSMSRLPRPENRYLEKRPYIAGAGAAGMRDAAGWSECGCGSRRECADKLILSRPKLRHTAPHAIDDSESSTQGDENV